MIELVADRAGDSVQVEQMGSVSLATRIATPMLFATVRLGLEALTLVGRLSPVKHKQVFSAGAMVEAAAALLAPPRGTRRREVRFEGFRAEWVWCDRTAAALDDKQSAILYFHGGAFIACGLNTHRRMVARIGRAGGAPVFAVDYRQLPKAHLTETIEDCLAAYLHLLDEGFPAERIVLAGDSAGGGLAFLVALAARDRGLPLPGAITGISPWSDLDNTARLAHLNVRRDPFIPAPALGIVADWGFAIDGKLDPRWSPANHNFTGLPPVLIQVGSTEILLSDAERLAQRCAEAGVDCVLQIWDRGFHVFPVAADLIPEGMAAIESLGTFIRRFTENENALEQRRAG